MPLTKSKRILNSLLEAEEKLHNIYLAKQSGEQYNPLYKKNKEIFRKLVRTDLALEREMRKYFKGLTDRIHHLIRWDKYNTDLLKKASDIKKASVSDWILSNWTAEGLELKVILTDTLMDAIAAGGNMTEQEMNIDIGWNSSNDMAADFMNKYSGKLAESLNSTTFDRVKSTLSLSLSLGENQSVAGARIDEIINDKRRAAVIAHTESVRSFSAGRLAVGVQIGADRKQWDATLKACPICGTLDGTIVPINESFGQGISVAPAHPNCRCLIKILMPDEGNTQPESVVNDPFSVFKNFFDNI